MSNTLNQIRRLAAECRKAREIGDDPALEEARSEMSRITDEWRRKQEEAAAFGLAVGGDDSVTRLEAQAVVSAAIEAIGQTAEEVWAGDVAVDDETVLALLADLARYWAGDPFKRKLLAAEYAEWHVTGDGQPDGVVGKAIDGALEALRPHLDEGLLR